jgi:hypothetical protein
MKFLKDLLVITEAQKKGKNKDLSALPPDAIKEIKKLIKDGAEDLDKEWVNALELVQQAYKVAGVERPTPSERSAWEQYEEMLVVGVEELSKNRKNNKDWKMSSDVFHEAMEKRMKIRVFEIGDKFAKGHTVEARNMQEILEMIRKQAGDQDFEMDVKEHDPSSCTCHFYYHGVKRPYHVKLQRL